MTTNTITCICENCHAEFDIQSKHYRYNQKNGYTPGRFCSRQCCNTFFKATKTKSSQVACEQCGVSFTKLAKELARSKHNFCSKSCAAKYHNAHKTTGTRRSRLEAYIESQLRTDFHGLELICNGKEAIGSELDFYFPQLRLAIELNGIFHYEPIYGPDRLERIQANDQQKFLACAAAGIELCVIDTSSVNHITDSVKVRYYTIVKDLVARLIERADSANVQAP